MKIFLFCCKLVAVLYLICHWSFLPVYLVFHDFYRGHFCGITKFMCLEWNFVCIIEKCGRRLTVTQFYLKHKRMSGTKHSETVVEWLVICSVLVINVYTDQNRDKVQEMVLKNHHSLTSEFAQLYLMFYSWDAKSVDKDLTLPSCNAS